MKVKELKQFLESLPEDADERDVVFSAKNLKGLYAIAGSNESYFHDEAPEGITREFILLWSGVKP